MTDARTVTFEKNITRREEKKREKKKKKKKRERERERERVKRAGTMLRGVARTLRVRQMLVQKDTITSKLRTPRSCDKITPRELTTPFYRPFGTSSRRRTQVMSLSSAASQESAPKVSAPTLEVEGGDVFPVRRVYCVGKNYAAHTIEMG